MANLTLTVATVSSTKTIDTAKAMTIVDNYIIARGGPTNGTNQAKIDWLLDDWMIHVRDVGINHLRSVAAENAQATAGAWE